ncbi:hypothetical protein ACIHCQ_11580 [Streptomyces sp. NPDC052236]|uniref:hypothetical protein n=1 Tax=Streptomyces sp. NPDC052236 TaxID=3365686 RepID=UPI0037D3EBAB
MKTRLLTALSGLLLALSATAVGAAAPTAGAPAATGPETVAEAFEDGPVYVDPRASTQLSPSEANALADKIEDADKPLFVAVLPTGSEFPENTVLQNIRAQTGITGLYAIRLGDGFNAGADSSVMSDNAVDNLVTAVKTPAGVDAATQLDNFVDQALPQIRGSAPASWDTGGPGPDADAGALITLGAVAAAGGVGVYAVTRRNRRQKAEAERAALDRLRVVVDEDITAYGEELDRLDFHPSEKGADDVMRADYERALDSYDKAKSLMGAAEHPSDVRGVTQALEDGRYSLAVLDARRTGQPVPERRSPCFFDPRHGPSVTDVLWSPPGGATRDVPVCAADAARLEEGEDPMARTVETDYGRRPYWEAGPVYGPWAGGYFGGGILPGLLMGTMLGSMLSTPAYGSEYGGGEFTGGEYSGADFNSSDFGSGGDWGGGGDFGGGF